MGNKMTNNEIPLTGGRITNGVVRVGNTVRRPRQASSAFVEKLLTHLERQGIDIALHYLGVDNDGRDTFSYLEGTVPAKFKHFSDEQVARAGALIRSYHDATRGSELAGDYPVVCHYDAGPNNFVFQNDMPYALIDFDLAAPGNPLEDIGYMAWLWCISSKSDRQPAVDQAAQVRLLADSYGLEDSERQLMFDAIIERQAWNIDFWSKYLTHPKPEVATHEQVAARIEWTKHERSYVLNNRAAFVSALM
jgi:tRNA A-37 threonylcarbamoyl transferase component Bud32